MVQRRTADGAVIRQLSVSVMNSITTNQKKRIVANLMIFNNSGDETVLLDGTYSISPGEKLTLGGWESLNIFNQEFSFSFSGGGTNPRLDILTIDLIDPAHAQYEQLEKFR